MRCGEAGRGWVEWLPLACPRDPRGPIQWWSGPRLSAPTQFASEIAAVTEDGGDALLRKRVGRLDDDQPLLLREVLDEVKIAF